MEPGPDRIRQQIETDARIVESFYATADDPLVEALLRRIANEIRNQSIEAGDQPAGENRE